MAFSPHSASCQPASPQSVSPGVVHQTDLILGPLVILLPLSILLGVVAYRKSQVILLRRRIATLEKLWQISIDARPRRNDGQ